MTSRLLRPWTRCASSGLGHAGTIAEATGKKKGGRSYCDDVGHYQNLGCPVGAAARSPCLNCSGDAVDTRIGLDLGGDRNRSWVIQHRSHSDVQLERRFPGGRSNALCYRCRSIVALFNFGCSLHNGRLPLMASEVGRESGIRKEWHAIRAVGEACPLSPYSRRGLDNVISGMNPIRPGRIYGSIAAIALLAVFVTEPQRRMPEQICGVLSFWQTNCVVGVQALHRWTILYCLLAGYLISRVVNRSSGASWWISLRNAISATVVSAVPLMMGFSLYYH